MAWDLWKRKTTQTDFARGEPPPADSIEWAGIPQSAANMMAGEAHRTAEERKLSNNGRVFMEWIVLRTKLTGKPGDEKAAGACSTV